MQCNNDVKWMQKVGGQSGDRGCLAAWVMIINDCEYTKFLG